MLQGLLAVQGGLTPLLSWLLNSKAAAGFSLPFLPLFFQGFLSKLYMVIEGYGRLEFVKMFSYFKNLASI